MKNTGRLPDLGIRGSKLLPAVRPAPSGALHFRRAKLEKPCGLFWQRIYPKEKGGDKANLQTLGVTVAVEERATIAIQQVSI
jgi:hypothetical protein